MFYKFIYEGLEASLGLWFKRILVFTWEFSMALEREFYWLSRFRLAWDSPVPNLGVYLVPYLRRDCMMLGFFKGMQTSQK